MKKNDLLLSVNDLKTYFYTPEGVVKAVDGVTFDVGKGEMVGIVGESGCGKSVTAFSILNLVRPPGKIVGGEVTIDGDDLHTKAEEYLRKIRGDKMSMIFQDPLSSLNPVYSIGWQIEESLKLHQDLTTDEMFEKSVDMLERVGISDPSKNIFSFPQPSELGTQIGVVCYSTLWPRLPAQGIDRSRPQGRQVPIQHICIQWSAARTDL